MLRVACCVDLNWLRQNSGRKLQLVGGADTARSKRVKSDSAASQSAGAGGLRWWALAARNHDVVAGQQCAWFLPQARNIVAVKKRIIPWQLGAGGSRAVVLRFEIFASRSSGTCEAGGSTCAHPVPEDQPEHLVGCGWSRLPDAMRCQSRRRVCGWRDSKCRREEEEEWHTAHAGEGEVRERKTLRQRRG